MERKIVVITGGTRGLGLHLAMEFRKRNYGIVICGTSQESVDRALMKIRECPGEGEVIGCPCNVSELSRVEALAELALEHFGKIDIWINNAGINQNFRYAWELEEKEIDLILSVDLKGTINGTNTAIRQMQRQGFGAVYNVEGMGSNDAVQPCFSLYGTAKRAVTYYTDAVAKECRECGLPVVVGKLSPGIMITDFLTSAEGEQGKTRLNEQTKKVYNILGDRPEEVAAYLAGKIEKNTKNGCRIAWLTGPKAAFRFISAIFRRRDYFSDTDSGQ